MNANEPMQPPKVERRLSGRAAMRSQPAVMLAKLADYAGEELLPDYYGEGDVIRSFEEQIAGLLGKEAAVFMPSGTMAQQIALRIWAERNGCNNVAFHPTCHLQLHEQMGYQALHGLNGILVGEPTEMLTLADLQTVSQPVSTLLLELPQREIGGQLPKWEELVEIVGWARGRDIRLHMDGARLWECKTFYQKEYAEIAALFDSVYVSMYKGLGAIAGAVLAGEEGFIAEARVWLWRHGGNLISMYPFVLSARLGIQEFLPKMDSYYRKTREVAEVLSTFEQVRVLPNPPQVNMMHVFIQAEPERMKTALEQVAQESGIQLFRRMTTASVPGFLKTELTIQDGALEISRDELREALELLFHKIESR